MKHLLKLILLKRKYNEYALEIIDEIWRENQISLAILFHSARSKLTPEASFPKIGNDSEIS